MRKYIVDFLRLTCVKCQVKEKYIRSNGVYAINVKLPNSGQTLSESDVSLPKATQNKQYYPTSFILFVLVQTCLGEKEFSFHISLHVLTLFVDSGIAFGQRYPLAITSPRPPPLLGMVRWLCASRRRNPFI